MEIHGADKLRTGEKSAPGLGLPESLVAFVVALEGCSAGLMIHGVKGDVQRFHLSNDIGVVSGCNKAVGKILDDGSVGSGGSGNCAAVDLNNIIAAFLVGGNIGIELGVGCGAYGEKTDAAFLEEGCAVANIEAEGIAVAAGNSGENLCFTVEGDEVELCAGGFHELLDSKAFRAVDGGYAH